MGDIAENKPVPAAPIVPAPPVKKRPGRPKKKVASVNIPWLGIVQEPKHQDHLIELVYADPIMFKKILANFKSYDTSEIDIYFMRDRMIWIGRDHHQKATINAVIDCRHMNFYYCGREIHITAKCALLVRTFAHVDKTTFKASLVVTESRKSILYIATHGAEYDERKKYCPDVVYKGEIQAPPALMSDEDYPLSFILGAKFFKKEIAIIRSMSKILVIDKVGESPMQLTYDKTSQMEYGSELPSPEKMQLKSKIGPGEIFRISAAIEYIKPFANSGAGDIVKISADWTRDLSMSTHVERKDDPGSIACVIKVFVAIRSYRPAAEPEEPAE